MERTDSKFHLVHLAAKRAREINAYYAQLGEGMKNYVPPLVSIESSKPLTIALEEIAAGKIEHVEPSEEEEEDPLAFIEAPEEGEGEAETVDLEAIDGAEVDAPEGDGAEAADETDEADEVVEADATDETDEADEVVAEADEADDADEDADEADDEA